MKKNYAAATLIIYLIPFFCAAQTASFNYTGVVQEFVVPAFVTSVDVDVRGAEGSSDGAGWGTAGKGGRVQASLTVTPGETLYVFVGGAGATPAGGFNGGGDGGTANTGPTGGGGGGMSNIRQGGNLWTDIAVAAGGGGGCGGYNGVAGGDGGDVIGDTGTTGAAGGGGGGTQISGGAGGAGAGNCGLAGTSGSQTTGGTGGNTTCGNGFGGGGGGGGGYYGGGGGGAAAYLLCCPDWSGGGGGGSSYIDTSAAILFAHTRGFQTGNGLVTLTYILTGVDAHESSSGVKVFRNPATSQLEIYSNASGAIRRIEIIDGLGRNIFRQMQPTNDNKLTIDIASLVPGIYFVRVLTEKGIRTVKIVKQ